MELTNDEQQIWNILKPIILNNIIDKISPPLSTIDWKCVFDDLEESKKELFKLFTGEHYGDADYVRIIKENILT